MAVSLKNYRVNEPSEWLCLSSDTKPAPSTHGKLKVYDTVLEEDTGNRFIYLGTTAGWNTTYVDGAASVEPTQLAHERNPGTSNQYGASVEEWNYTSWAHGDGDTIVTSNAALLKAVIVNSALTGDVAIRDGTTAGGTLIYTVGTTDIDLYGIKCNSGLFIDDNATAGNILVIWRDQ